MRFAKGRNRYAIIVPEIGLVVKLPRIYVKYALRALTIDVIHDGWASLWTDIRRPMRSRGGFRYWLFSGFDANILEFWVYLKTRSSFLQPTYFSLFGLVNFQKYGAPCTLKDVDLWCQLHELTEGKSWDDGHHFSNPVNFTLDGKHLRMLDYGGRKVQRVVKDYGAKIAANFDPTYDWDQICKTRE